MKKVRYALGAAGLAPAALGLALPAAAGAATHAATHAARPAGKTVSLRHTRMAGPGHAAVDSSCTGSVSTWKSKGTSAGEFFIIYWYKSGGDSTCVGTVHGTFSKATANIFGDVRIYHSGGKLAPYGGDCSPGAKSCTAVVRRWIPDLSSVCVEWTNRKTGTKVGGICRDPIPG